MSEMHPLRLPKMSTQSILSLFVILPMLLCAVFISRTAAEPYKLTFPSGSYARAQFAGALPSDLEEFTVCFWVKIHAIANDINTILYYSSSEDENEIRCFFDKNLFGFYRRSGIARTRPGVISLGEWYHICNIWSSWNGQWHIFVNGHLEGNGTGMATGQKVAQKGQLMIGPNQNEMDYDLSSRHSFPGSVADINLWDEALAEEWVEKKFHCCPIEGNVIAWSKANIVMNGGVTLSPSYHCRRDCHDASETEKYSRNNNKKTAD